VWGNAADLQQLGPKTIHSTPVPQLTFVLGWLLDIEYITQYAGQILVLEVNNNIQTYNDVNTMVKFMSTVRV